VWKTGHTSPVSSSNWDDVQLGGDDGTSDGSGDFRGALNSKTDVSVVVSDGDEGLESGSLTGRTLLLDWHDSHDFVGESGAEEVINDLVLLNRNREKEDLFDGGDSSVFN